MRPRTSELPVKVELDGTRTEDVRLAVSNAAGIAPEVMPQLFDPFRSGERQESGNQGLGLYIVQQIVLAHDGSIDVESATGQRTVFRVRLPRRSNR